jgi:hypothetical protein
VGFHDRRASTYKSQGAGAELRYKIQMTIVCLVLLSVPVLGFWFIKDWSSSKKVAPAIAVRTPGESARVTLTVGAGAVAPVASPVAAAPTRDPSHPFGVTHYELTHTAQWQATLTALPAGFPTPDPLR